MAKNDNVDDIGAEFDAPHDTGETVEQVTPPEVDNSHEVLEPLPAEDTTEVPAGVAAQPGVGGVQLVSDLHGGTGADFAAVAEVINANAGVEGQAIPAVTVAGVPTLIINAQDPRPVILTDNGWTVQSNHGFIEPTTIPTQNYSAIEAEVAAARAVDEDTTVQDAGDETDGGF